MRDSPRSRIPVWTWIATTALLIVLAAALLLTLRTPEPAPLPTFTLTPALTATQIPIPSERIAFSSDRDGNFEIYTIEPDGENLTRLTTDPADDSNPAWSPDGTRIAFDSNRGGTNHIYVMNADGSNVTQLAIGREPDWSPDGTQITYLRGTLYRMNADGTNSIEIVDRFVGAYPVWLPDGSEISYQSVALDVFTVMTVDVYSGVISPLLPYTDGVTPAWSPDATRIAYISTKYDDRLVIRSADYFAPQQIFKPEPDSWYVTPAWSPDGTRIVLRVSHADGSDGLYILSVTTAELIPLITDLGHEQTPDWSPIPIP
jgi:Tol biopolymer transport system component